ncbi:NAD-dependent epimerase/dehydratase family protein [Tengunoibacter tsumagoiensis]|uniref:Nucleoside-diphosphate sugar epimerase n=1 Tax=Tengunoibacter tsumagoiensis TaxID=2014871 RepID=A0A401ZVE2_9CHLR|nr:NAD-dependent epimerase/dehydratase family protein [Tengunoibacter tsumagoiensis]GCE10710.1 nucleoside-diphosphate sugar epimerase [Tengunoibacter tsumagoiensis]
MNIFITGATGVLGRPVVQSLVAAGHTVRALSRSEHNAATIRSLGAKPVSADLFDATELKQILVGSNAVVHLATKIPPTAKIGRRTAWLENDHLRRDGTRNLVEAARAIDSIETFIYPGYSFVYPDSSDNWIDASTTPTHSSAILQSTLDAEEAVAQFAAEGHRGLSLRMGSFYGPETPDPLTYARRGIAVFPGRSEAYLPQIWVQDAASAIVTALTEPIPSGIYDVVDDEPLTRGELITVMAQAVGRKHLLHPPTPVMRMLTGVVYDVMTRSLRISNRRFKEASSWQPEIPDARIGWTKLAQTN